MANGPQIPGARHSILELAPLELDCMNALWVLGEATVREIQQALVESRPRAYTTIMTIMDRLAQKGTVLRSKTGRAWVYRPNLSADEARSHAVARVVDGFFKGSAEALALHLSQNRSAGTAAATLAISQGGLRLHTQNESETRGVGSASGPDPLDSSLL